VPYILAGRQGRGNHRPTGYNEKMSDPGPDILYEKGPCLVVNKPPGVLTQAPPGIDSMEVRLRAFLRERAERPDEAYVGVPHRLDRPASGAMLFGLSRRATRRLSEQFEGRRVRKTYWAKVEGRVQPPSGTWRDFVRKVPGVARAEIVPEGHREGRVAVLHYRVLKVGHGVTWLEIELETGRTHQVRVQAAARGYPVLGDALYGSTVPFGPQHDDERLRAIALHARSLEFVPPGTRERASVVAPVPEFWNSGL
jgi:23S rRNA pseudouridine1911/1915/1917 synthase